TGAAAAGGDDRRRVGPRPRRYLHRDRRAPGGVRRACSRDRRRPTHTRAAAHPRRGRRADGGPRVADCVRNRAPFLLRHLRRERTRARWARSKWSTHRRPARPRRRPPNRRRTESSHERACPLRADARLRSPGHPAQAPRARADPDDRDAAPPRPRGPARPAKGRGVMTGAVTIPLPDGGLERLPVFEASTFTRPNAKPSSRRLLAAAHVVAEPLSGGPGPPDRIDLEATLAVRRHLWWWGLGVADAMDTAQRGMGLSWEAARELIARSIEEARACDGDLVSGAQTDQLEPGSARTLADIEAAYQEQVGFIEGLGGRVVIMASRELARIASGTGGYHTVYGNVLSRLRQPTIIHWLGEVFDPALAGYWGHQDIDTAMDVLLDVISENVAHVDGIKLSLLDQQRELAMRERLPDGVR